jgi:hypothetical protein
VPLGVSFFHPSGVSLFLQATYFNQDVKLEQLAGGRSGRAEFWIFDPAISYRLPMRYGFITIGATNVLDKDFKFFDRDLNNPSIQPDRMFYGKITLALP